MSGFEIAGVVLGGFPILLNCLEYYREGFEPLEEWWNFRTHFIAFVDDIRHQMMRYHENMIRLLDPIIADTDDLASLVRDSSLADPRWHDGSLEGALKERLASEYDRFFRILARMEEVLAGLEKLLQIDNGKVSWVGLSQHKPWQWHYRRMRISFSKGKHKKIRKLIACNEELEEILGYSERIIPIADKRKASEPVGLFEKIRQHACGVYNALKRQWRCGRSCQLEDHEAHLNLSAAAVSISLDVMFILSRGPDDPRLSWQQVQIVPTEARPAVSTDIGHIHQSTLLASAQQRLMRQNRAARAQNLMSTSALKLQPMHSSPGASSLEKDTRSPPRSEKSVKFDTLDSATSSKSSSNTTLDTATQPPSLPRIADLCLFLGSEEPRSGLLEGDTDRHFHVHKLAKGLQTSATCGALQLVPLPELMAAYHHALIDIARQRRFEMATHIATALLQAHTSPWLSKSWSKTDFHFLVDTETGSLCSTYPFLSRSFHLPPSPVTHSKDECLTYSDNGNSASSKCTQASVSGFSDEEDTRACLFTVGVMILELIFGHNIEDCHFRREYYGHDNKPNDQTDACTARRWAKKALGESGASVADVIRRCLDCSFGPRPSFRDVRFRESVYEGVIKPLVDYSKAWPEVMP